MGYNTAITTTAITTTVITISVGSVSVEVDVGVITTGTDWYRD